MYVFNEFKIRGWQNGEFLFCVKQRIDFITFLWVPMHKRGGDTTTTRSWNEKITHSPLTQVTASKQKKVSTSKGKTKNKLASCFICAKRRVIAFVFVFDGFYFILKRLFNCILKIIVFFICHVFHCFFHLDRNRGYVLRSRKKN